MLHSTVVPPSPCVCRSWLQLLWQWLSRQPQGALRECLGLPLLPVQDRQLLPLPDRQIGSTALLDLEQRQGRQGSATGATPATVDATTATTVATAAGDGGDGGSGAAPVPPDDVLQVLLQLGCHAVDAASFQLPVRELLSSHVHPMSAIGALHALYAANQGHSRPQQQQQQGQAHAPEQPPVVARAHALPATFRHLLRTFLLTEECLAAASPGSGVGAGTAAGAAGAAAARSPLLLLLSSLPLYEGVPTTLTHMAPSGASPPAVVFVDLLGACYVEPQDFDASTVLACYCDGQPAAAAAALVPVATGTSSAIGTSGSKRSGTAAVPLGGAAAPMARAPKYVRASNSSERQLLAKYLGASAPTPADMYLQARGARGGAGVLYCPGDASRVVAVVVSCTV